MDKVSVNIASCRFLVVYVYIYHPQHKPDFKFHIVLILTPTIYSTINMLNTFDNGTISLGVIRLQLCCHLLCCTCSGCGVASFILIVLKSVTAYRV